MDDIERMVVGVRADTAGFAREVETMRGTLEDGLGAGAARAGRAIEDALLRSVRSGKFGLEDLKRAALGVLAEIARAAVHDGVRAVTGGGGAGASLAGALAGLAGLPGRATGGPVSPGRGYIVGERGPELFVPTTSGRVDAGGRDAAPRAVRVSITVNAGPGEAPAALQRSGRQIARAVRAALAD
ncbi:tail tape measure protein [Sphingomonas sp. A2-49]|uniref:tail tape measure protein n=1 Tax=Sphingomonas sp. A2-49 TaxID=1391375 RepID=UPI0021CF8B64|nr:tail tape measure protein [Sphingomonas sp. A2-49]MCU6455861.1 tail tape measure protein [Sphingomonas sp. A2-49]